MLISADQCASLGEMDSAE